MTPQKEEKLNSHIEAIAKILYEETNSEDLVRYHREMNFTANSENRLKPINKFKINPFFNRLKATKKCNFTPTLKTPC